MITFFEWAGSLLGLAGALLLAMNVKASAFGWFFFLAANFAMVAFALCIRRYGLMLQQIGFTATSVLGIYRAFLST